MLCRLHLRRRDRIWLREGYNALPPNFGERRNLGNSGSIERVEQHLAGEAQHRSDFEQLASGLACGGGCVPQHLLQQRPSRRTIPISPGEAEVIG